MAIKDLLEKRATIWNQAQAVLQKARDEKRAMTSEEQQQFDRMSNDMIDLGKTIDAEQRAAEMERQMGASVNSPVRPQTGSQGERRQELDKKYRAAMNAYIRSGLTEMDPAHKQLLVERRAMSAVTGNLGGYAIVDQSFGRLVDEIKSIGGIRQSRAEILTTANGASIPIPVGDDTANKGRRLAENGTANTTTDPTINQRKLDTFLYTSEIVKAPFALLDDASFDVEVWLWKKLAERIARITNEENTTGTGVDMPLGLVTGAGAGKVTVAGQVDSLLYADLVDLFMSVDAAYRAVAEWQLNDNTLKHIMKLVDQQGRPLWVPSLSAAMPDMILGKGYVVNNDMPDLGAGNKPIVFGDMNMYKVRDVRMAVIKRLEEKYIEEGMVGFVMFSRHGGTLASNGKAVKYLQNAAA